MLPAQRRDVGEQLVRYRDAAAAQMPDGAVKIDGVPEDDGSGEVRQSGGAMALVLEGAVAQFAEAVEKDGAGERVAGVALLRMLPVRRRCSGSSNQSSMNRVRSTRPISRKERATGF